MDFARIFNLLCMCMALSVYRLKCCYASAYLSILYFRFSDGTLKQLSVFDGVILLMWLRVVRASPNMMDRKLIQEDLHKLGHEMKSLP